MSNATGSDAVGGDLSADNSGGYFTPHRAEPVMIFEVAPPPPAASTTTTEPGAVAGESDGAADTGQTSEGGQVAPLPGLDAPADASGDDGAGTEEEAGSAAGGDGGDEEGSAAAGAGGGGGSSNILPIALVIAAIVIMVVLGMWTIREFNLPLLSRLRMNRDIPDKDFRRHVVTEAEHYVGFERIAPEPKESPPPPLSPPPPPEEPAPSTTLPIPPSPPVQHGLAGSVELPGKPGQHFTEAYSEDRAYRFHVPSGAPATVVSKRPDGWSVVNVPDHGTLLVKTSDLAEVVPPQT
jgi:hypothetical protein